MNLSKTIALKTRQELQAAHFAGNQYALHCSIILPLINKFDFHLSDDDRTHDRSFAYQL